jgi:FixJ family two-component response regulator
MNACNRVATRIDLVLVGGEAPFNSVLGWTVSFQQSSEIRMIAKSADQTHTKNNQLTAMPTVAIIDDDAAMRDSIESLLRSVGYQATGFDSSTAFSLAETSNRPNCLIVDVRLRGGSGLDLQAQLASTGSNVPIIFVTGHGDIPMASRAMKAGAIDFLTKPFRDQDLLDAVAAAIDRDRASTEQQTTRSRVRTLYDSLTAREKEVATYVAAGLMNKQIAAKIGLSEITVKVHRGSAMHKLGAKSIADLVRIVDALGGGPALASWRRLLLVESAPAPSEYWIGWGSAGRRFDLK